MMRRHLGGNSSHTLPRCQLLAKAPPSPQCVGLRGSHAIITLQPSRRGSTLAVSSMHGRVLSMASGNIRVDLSAYPDMQFFRIEAIMRPWRVSDVVHELTAAGILGMTQTNVLGAGVQGGTRERYKGTEHGLDNLVEKSKLEIVCFRTQVDTVVQIVCGAARTGEIGDGKIFVSPILDIVRIRTGETGATAERMEGGMSDQGG